MNIIPSYFLSLWERTEVRARATAGRPYKNPHLALSQRERVKK